MGCVTITSVKFEMGNMVADLFTNVRIATAEFVKFGSGLLDGFEHRKPIGEAAIAARQTASGILLQRGFKILRVIQRCPNEVNRRLRKIFAGRWRTVRLSVKISLVV